MQRIHKILGICLLVTALVFGVLKILGGAGFGDEAKGDTKASSRDSMARHDRGENTSAASTRKLRQRARKLTYDEATEFLNATVLPKIDLENITLHEALKIFNEEIAKQTSGDQSRPKILFFDDSNKTRALNSAVAGVIDLGSSKVDVRLRNVKASNALKFMCDQIHARFWFYKGDFYVSTIYDGGINHFSHTEKLNQLKLDDTDASQLVTKLNEVINQHDYFGPKASVRIFTTEKAHAALLKGELQLPRINLDLENITLIEALVKITEQSGGTLKAFDQNLMFNPFSEEPIYNDPFAAANSDNELRVLIDENIFDPKSAIDSAE